MSAAAEKFLDEAVTWREVGYNMAAHRPGFERYESLPEWARATLARHEKDPRPHLYSRQEFEAGATGDEIWNAAQGQLREEGRIHNYLRMLWGKKVLHWSKSPRKALEILVDLNADRLRQAADLVAPDATVAGSDRMLFSVMDLP